MWLLWIWRPILQKIEHSHGLTAQYRSCVDSIKADDILKDVNLHTDNSLFIFLQGEVAKDPEFVNISVWETFWLLLVNFYLDQHICFVKKNIRRLLGESFWGIKRHQNWKGDRKTEKNLFLLGWKKITVWLSISVINLICFE